MKPIHTLSLLVSFFLVGCSSNNLDKEATFNTKPGQGQILSLTKNGETREFVIIRKEDCEKYISIS